LLAVPFAVFTAHRALGNLLIRLGLCALPEENMPPKILRELDVPAIVLRGHA
jgi:membrane glycosyltransferase